MNRFKTLKAGWPIFAIAGVGALSVGTLIAVVKTTHLNPRPEPSLSQSIKAVAASPVLALVSQPVEMRQAALTELAQKKSGIERDRARYLLASDLLEQGKGESAIPVLEDLAESYDALTPYALLKKGQAQATAGQSEAAQETWQQLAARYPTSAATGEALFQLGRQSDAQSTGAANPYWQTLLTQIPSHPRSIEVAFSQLAAAKNQSKPTAEAPAPSPAAGQNAATPDQPALLKLIARYGIHHPNYEQALNQLTKDYSNTLTPEDWGVIGFGYWENQNYAKAGDAYAKAANSPVNLYRAARGKERGGKTQEAAALYRQLNQTYPTSPETADGLLNLANLLQRPEAIKTLDEVIARFPDRAAEALAQRADVLEAMKSPKSAKQARASILSQYPTSQAAADIRLAQAKANAKKGDFSAAISWLQQQVEAAPDTAQSAEAGFWLGKWLLRKNQPAEARAAFEQVIRTHPESYFAWRSAVHLDWKVGDFDNVRNFQPQVALPAKRTPLPAGSATLKELYLLGQDQAAWAQWQSEFINPQNPTVAEQFTDGVLRLGVGDHLDGIFMASSLAWRESPQEKSDYKALTQESAYWQTLYPFPYAPTILGWAEQRSLNPLLVTALVRQESRFQPEIKSAVGAVGLMQVMPETAEWIAEQNDIKSYSMTKPEDNVKFGTWYLDFTHSQYSDNSLYAVASYNAGPTSVSEWIKEGGFSNADEFVEKIPYPETKGYISSVFGGYWNYLRLYNPEIAEKIEQL